MKILVFISKEADRTPLYHDTALTLCRQLSARAEVELTSSFKGDLSAYDVAHVMGSWSMSAARLLLRATRKQVPTVFSPLGGLEPWMIRKHATEKWAKRLVYQRRMVQQASAVHLLGKMELKSFQQLQWNERYQVIKNCLLTGEITAEEMASQMLALYQKVIDSNCYSMIREPQQDALASLLLAGIDRESWQWRNENDRKKEDKKNHEWVDCLRKLQPNDWRHLFIYAFNEGILVDIRHGIEAAKQPMPAIDVASIGRFPVPYPVNKEELESETLISKNPILKNKLHEVATEKLQEEKKICVMVLNIRSMLRQKTLSMRHLLDFYREIRYQSYDEEELSLMLKQLGYYKFASRLIFILQDVIGLTEGFTPIEPTDDHETDQLRKKITKLQ